MYLLANMKRLCVGLLAFLLLTGTCSATRLKYICDYGEYDSHIYLDVDSIRLAEKNDKYHRGFVFRTFWKPSGYDRMKYLATNMSKGSSLAYKLYTHDYSYDVYIYEVDLKYGMRLITAEFYNHNDALIHVLNFKESPYENTRNHSRDYLIAKSAYAAAREKFPYIKSLPYYEHASQSYK